MPKDKNQITIRVLVSECLTFVASRGDNDESVEMRYENENIWLTQKMMAVFYDIDVRGETEFEKYHIVQDRLFIFDFNKFMIDLKSKK